MTTKNKRISYTSWTDDEIKRILDIITINRHGKIIDWAGVHASFPHRTAQQCKSFYNNFIKQFVFELVDGVPVPNLDFVKYCHAFYITRYKPRKETMEQKVRRIVAENCYEDGLTTAVFLAKQEQNYNYNNKLLVGTSEMIKFHYSQKQLIDEQFKNTEQIILSEMAVTRNQWEHFCQFVDTLHPFVFLKKIEDKLQNLETESKTEKNDSKSVQKSDMSI
ncbi:Myb-like_DNA-binding domain-containing protein [Hexamita inflata]|uniref:Myb-like DNA-binding domain-containing protein n=1 Tax=Hexamita inflata TaxID=28002 RepID=A0AA86P9T6_9EUKA|nr:Myb-like DNA-binding domain-containing protein [Hexamita inflata]